MMRIHTRIDEIVDDADTAESLKPWYMLMCKRPCFHNDYLPTLQPCRTCAWSTPIGKAGVTADQQPKVPCSTASEFEVDLIIYATGFEVQKTGIYNHIIGEGGLDLNDKYQRRVFAPFSVSIRAGYPNLFIMGGYQAFFAFNLTDVLNSQGEHISECIDYARRNDVHSIDCTDDAEEWWVQEVIDHRGKTTRNRDCTPGYYNFEGAENRRQDGNYNGTMSEYLDHMAAVRADMPANFHLTTR